MLRRGRRWRRLPSNLGQEKYSVSLTEDLGSQRGRGERPAASRVTATFPFLPQLRYFSGELARAGHGEGEGGWLRVSLQRRGDAERGQMASRAGKERGCWALSARSGRGLGFTRRKRLGGLGSGLGMALWSRSSAAGESASGFLSRSQIDRVQLTCAKIVSRPR
jgi:hypothetical protein